MQHIDDDGGVGSEIFLEIGKDFSYIPHLKVDRSLDPFSDQYFEQMVGLYEEISGRTLDQDTGEMTSFDLEQSTKGANSYGTDDVAFISAHAQEVMAAISVCNPPPRASVLDLGCGWGLSSELIGFTGANVTAVDINPMFIELIRRRTQQGNLSIQAICSNFDRLKFDPIFDIAFFYECLHDSVRPWETIEQISGFMNEEGRIAFAGEPINNLWWPASGPRLDLESVYCVRKFGWFESGWSNQFISECFERCGWKLRILPGVGLCGGPIGVADRIGTDYSRPLRRPFSTKTPKPKSFRTLRNIKRRLLGRELLPDEPKIEFD